jgi:hypothetical protein
MSDTNAHVQRTKEYDSTPTLRLVEGELVVLPAWMNVILDAVLPRTEQARPIETPDLFGGAA